ncbi:MAG: hypothetical protein K9L64_05790 [Candidatus Izimaplasma sp.]|nr:hypothetical protein [Candidatus Izimaplasma bacterium]
MEYILIGLGLTVFLALYFWSYSINQKTEKPSGTVEIDCKGCNATSCGDRKNDYQK